MKRLVLMMTVLLLLMPSTVYGSFEDKGVFGEQVERYIDNSGESPDLTEKTLAKLFISPMNWILSVFGMQDVVILVFGKNPAPEKYVGVYEKGSLWDCMLASYDPTSPYFDHDFGYGQGFKECREARKIGEKLDDFLQGNCVGTTDCRGNRILGVFDTGMTEAIDALYSVFELFLPFPLIIALLLIGGLMLYRGMTADGRTDAKDYVKAFIVALLSLRFGYYLWTFVAYLVNTFTDIIWATLEAFGVKGNLFLNMIWGTGLEGYQNLVSMQGLAIAAIVVSATLMTFALNYQYAVRSIMLMVLVVLFPVACTLTVFPRFRHSLQIWWEEFVSNMILPVAHAVALGLFFLLLHFSSLGVSVWIIIAYFFGLPTVTNLVRKLVGTAESSGGRWGSMAGIAGLAGIASLGKMLKPKKAAFASQNTGTEGKVTIADDEQLPPSESVSGNRSFLSPKNLINSAGKVAGFGLKAAGAMTGYAVGAMAGNASAGTMIGGLIGGGAGKGAAWAGGAAAQTSAWAAHKTSQGLSAAKQRLNQGISGLMHFPAKKAAPVPNFEPEHHEKDITEPMSGMTAHMPASYRAAQSKFWKTVDLNRVMNRDEVVSLHNAGKLRQHNELEKAFHRPKDHEYYL